MHLSDKFSSFLARHWRSLFFLFVLTTVAFLNAIAPINSYDFWWHLKTGDYILAFRGLPEVDPFTYTALLDDSGSPGKPALAGTVHAHRAGTNR